MLVKRITAFEKTTAFYSVALVFVLFLGAHGDEKPKLQLWQLRGLSRAFDDDDPQVRVTVVRALIRDPVDSGKLPLPQFPKRGETSQRFMEEARKLASRIAELLEEQSPADVKRNAALALARMGAAAEVAVPQLAMRLKEPDSDVRKNAAFALGRIGAGAKVAVPELIKLLEEKDLGVKSTAAYALGEIGIAAEVAVPRLIELLEDPDSDVRKNAALALGKYGRGGKDAVPQLIILLEDTFVASAAAEALGMMGETAKDAVPHLIRLLEDPDSTVKSSSSLAGESIRALGCLGAAAKDLVPQIVTTLVAQDYYVNSAAARALAVMGKDAVPQLVKLLEDNDAVVSKNAALALKDLGTVAEHEIPKLIKLLEDPRLHVTANVALVLGSMGSVATDAVPRLLMLLEDPHSDSDVKFNAALALSGIGTGGEGAVSQLMTLLKDQEPSVGACAAVALGNMGAAAKNAIPQLTKLLEAPDSDSDVRSNAALALGIMGAAVQEAVGELYELASDPQSYWRGQAALALGNMGEVSVLAGLLGHHEPDVRRDAAFALGKMGPAAKDAVLDMAKLLEDFHADVVVTATDALASMGPTASVAVPQIAKLLGDKLDNRRVIALVALEKLGEVAKHATPQIVTLLEDQDSGIRNRAAQCLISLGPHHLSVVVEVLNEALRHADRSVDWRVLAFLVAGEEKLANSEMVGELIYYLGNWQTEYRREIPENLDERRKLLDGLEEVWEATTREQHYELRRDIAALVSELVRAGGWRTEDLKGLQNWHQTLRKTPVDPGFPDQTLAVANQISVVNRWDSVKSWTSSVLMAIAGHLSFWLALVFLYPRSPQVQATFFWAPWIRRIVGLGYIGLLLAWIPFLRNRLFAPFRKNLLADAVLDDLKEEAYFGDLNVQKVGSGESQAIDDAIPAIKGRILLEGESGLGKSMFVRHLASESKRLVVFLRAGDCSAGVMHAIQNKLHGPAKDENYLNTLIFSGAVDVCIDGLNEVDPNTRAEIRMFVEQNFHGNIIVTTQPIDWMPPADAKKYTLQPLKDEAIEQFLLSRQESWPEHSTIRETQFTERCRSYLSKALAPDQPEETLATTKRALSNPMDLTVVAQILSEGKEPDLFRLGQQQYEVMAEEYKRTNAGAEFPLASFSETVYQMCSTKRGAGEHIPDEGFAAELRCMEVRKMVVLRHSKDKDGKITARWYFRHDKIAEFFIVQTFLAHGERALEHLGEPPFRGVYFLLATLLPKEAAMKLREELLQHAVKTKDTTVLAPFVELLNARDEKARSGKH